MSVRRDDRGSVTAEFAVVVPAALFVVLLVVAALLAAGTQVRLEHAAAQAARLVARGEDDSRARSAVTAAVTGARLVIRHEGDLVCAVTTAESGVPLPVPPLRAESCALAGGL